MSDVPNVFLSMLHLHTCITYITIFIALHYCQITKELADKVEYFNKNEHFCLVVEYWWMLTISVATSTLAMGVNLPAHLVVVKSTMHYVMGVYQEYQESQVLQMIGRAGRPQVHVQASIPVTWLILSGIRYYDMLLVIMWYKWYKLTQFSGSERNNITCYNNNYGIKYGYMYYSSSHFQGFFSMTIQRAKFSW